MRWMLALLAMMLTAPAAAAPGDVAGRWAVRSYGRVLMIVTLRHDRAGWRGAWWRPLHFQTDDGWRSLTKVAGPLVLRPLVAASPAADGVRLDFAGATLGERDSMLLRADGTGLVRLRWAGGPDVSLALDRAAANEAPIAPDPAATYPLDQHWPTNAEMTAIYDADQGDRAAGARVDWSVVLPRDRARKTRTRALLDASALASGDDFYHAAYVFQHGEAPDDFLLAHALAMVAVARGRPDATWIASATLDRYLHRIDRKQIFGTQYLMPQGQPTTQEPYDRDLVPDQLRRALGVPDLAAQAERRKRLEAEYHAAGK